MAPRDVQYGMEVVGALPEREYRASVLEDTLAAIKADTTLVGQAVIIARYRNRTAASAAASTLRRRHGASDAEGFKFECHRVDDRSALFVVYNPSWVTETGIAAHAEELAADKVKKSAQAKDRRAKKLAKDAEAGGSESGVKGKSKAA